MLNIVDNAVGNLKCLFKIKKIINFIKKKIIYFSLDSAPYYSLVTDQAVLSTALNYNTISQTKHNLQGVGSVLALLTIMTLLIEVPH